MRHKREIFVREFIFTDEEVRLMRELDTPQREAGGAQTQLFKWNVVKKGIEKRYRNIMVGGSASVDQIDPADSGSGFVRILSSPQTPQVVEGAHELTGIQNSQDSRSYHFKLIRCCCFSSKEKLGLRAELNQNIFYPSEELAVAVKLASSDEKIMRQVESVEVLLVQRVTAFQDIKRQAKRVVENVISRFVFRKPGAQKQLRCLFALEKLLWTDKRLEFIVEHLKVPNRAKLRYARLRSIMEMSSSNLKGKTVSDSKDFGVGDVISIEDERKEAVDIDSECEFGAVGGGGQHSLKVPRSALPLPLHCLRKIEAMNYSSEGHIVRNEFFVRVQLRAQGYSVEKRGELELPVKIR